MALLIVVGFGSSGNNTVVRDHDRLWKEVSPSGVAFAHVLYATGLWRLRCATLPGAMNWRARPWSRGPHTTPRAVSTPRASRSRAAQRSRPRSRSTRWGAPCRARPAARARTPSPSPTTPCAASSRSAAQASPSRPTPTTPTAPLHQGRQRELDLLLHQHHPGPALQRDAAGARPVLPPTPGPGRQHRGPDLGLRLDHRPRRIRWRQAPGRLDLRLVGTFRRPPMGP